MVSGTGMPHSPRLVGAMSTWLTTASEIAVFIWQPPPRWTMNGTRIDSS